MSESDIEVVDRYIEDECFSVLVCEAWERIKSSLDKDKWEAKR